MKLLEKDKRIKELTQIVEKYERGEPLSQREKRKLEMGEGSDSSEKKEITNQLMAQIDLDPIES